MSEAEDKSGEPVVFLYGYYGCGNLGDELLLSAVASGIVKRWPRAKFRVRNLGPIDPAPSLRHRIVETGLETILTDPRHNRFSRAVRYLRAANAAIRGCSCFVLGGGTLLHAKTGLASLTLLTLLAVSARLRGIPVVAIGLGVADLDRAPARLLTRFLVAMLSDLAVRDAASRNTLPDSRTARLTADLVFDWWPLPLPVEGQKSRDRPIVAVTLWSSSPRDESRIFGALAETLRLFTERGYALRFLVFQDADAPHAALSDRPAISRLMVALGSTAQSAEVVKPGTDTISIAAAFEGVALHCGARFHACVIASLLAIPSVGLATDPKVTSLCETFAMPSMPLTGVTTDKLATAFERALGQKISATAIDDLRRQSAANFNWFDAHPVRDT